MSAGAVMTFGSFLQANAPGRTPLRRGLAVLLSALVHGGALLAFVAVRVQGEPPPRPPSAPIYLRLAPPKLAARSMTSPPKTPPAARPARRPVRPAPVIQPPPEVPPPEASPEPPPDEAVDLPSEPAAEADEDEDEDAGAPAPVVVAGSAAGRAGGLAGGTGDPVLELREVARAPAVIQQVTPRYPQEARWKKIEGLVIVRVVVGRDGRVEPGQTRVIRSLPDLDVAAIAALEQWRFSPAIDHSGHPVRVVIEVPVRFTLR